MEISKGYASTIIASVFVLVLVSVLAFIGANPSILEMILGLPLYAKYGLLILGILIAVTDFAYPRIKEAVESGVGLKFNLSSLSSWIMTFIVIVLTVISTQPDLLKPILNDNYALFITVGVPLIVVFLKALNPRQAEN